VPMEVLEQILAALAVTLVAGAFAMMAWASAHRS
jgi:hypothetical protein